MLTNAVYTLVLISFVTTIKTSKEVSNLTSYDPGELLTKIFNPNVTIASRQRGYGLVFEDQIESQTQSNEEQYGLITFEENDKRLKFKDEPQNYDDNRPLRFHENGSQNDGKQDLPLRFEDEDLSRDQPTFQEDNKIDQSSKKRKRRRRRKPKNGLQNYQGISSNFQGVPQHFQGVPGLPGSRPEFPGPSGLAPNPYPVNSGFGPNPNVNPGFQGPSPFRRRRRPRPSLASDALTAVTGALTSIALYDDYQCVPRLLCEAAGGGSLGSNGVLDSIAGIQPLLSLLSAYNGISASPLFVFGRAVFLGMTSRGNTGTCRYAYPQCPTDPEQLIHYLNNHNGGFFRFFNAPLPNQNLEQFYNHLGENGQNLEQLYNNLGQNGQFLGQNAPNVEQNFIQNGQPIYGQYQQQLEQGQGSYGLYQNQPGQQNYGFQNNIGQGLGPYGQNYGSNYDYNTYGSNNVRFKDSHAKIEKRIQNKPVKDDVVDSYEDDNDNTDTKWLFPEETKPNINQNAHSDERDRETLKFPEESHKYDDKRDSTRKSKSILFPENQYNQNAYSNKKYLNSGNHNYNNNKVQEGRPFYQNNYNKVQTNRPYYQNNYSNKNQHIINANIYKQTTASPFNENDYYYDHKHNFYVKKNKNQVNYNTNYSKDQNKVDYASSDYYNSHKQVNYGNYNNYVNSKIKDDAIQTVYIVRGNGDPNRPEILKVRPGQAVN